MRQLFSFDTLLSTIESSDFFAEVALINKFDRFLVYLDTNSIIEQFIKIASIDISNARVIKARIYQLWRFECDSSKLHPYDHSIAVYLYTLFKSFVTEIDDVLDYVYKNQLPNMYWTYYVYNFILSSRPRVITGYCDHSEMSPNEKLTFINVYAQNSK